MEAGTFEYFAQCVMNYEVSDSDWCEWALLSAMGEYQAQFPLILMSGS